MSLTDEQRKSLHFAITALERKKPDAAKAIEHIRSALGFDTYECENGHTFTAEGEDPECPECALSLDSEDETEE